MQNSFMGNNKKVFNTHMSKSLTNDRCLLTDSPEALSIEIM